MLLDSVLQWARGRLGLPSHASRFAWQMPWSQHNLLSLAPLTWGGWQPAEEKSPTADGATYAGWPIQALCPCHMSLTLVFWLRHFKTTSFSCGWEKKRKGVRKSWHSLSLLKFSERASNKRRTRLRAKRSRAPPQKAAVDPYSFPHRFPHKKLRAGDRKKRPYPQKRMQRKCTYKGHL